MPDVTVTPSAAPSTPSAPTTSTPTPSTPSAPVSTPSTPDSGTPSTPDAGQGTTSSDGVPPPAGANGSSGDTSGDNGGVVTQGREPAQSDFPGDPEAYLKALYAWERGEKVELPADAAADGETQQKPADADADAEGDPDTDDDLNLIDDSADGYDTPQAFQEAIESTPGLKEIMDANPAVKNKFAAMARQNERLRPMGDIFPSVEAAQYANETANTFVGLRASIMSAADPTEMAGAFQQFSDQFKVVDKDGKPVLDAQGNPTFGEDYDLFTSTVVNAAMTDRLNALKNIKTDGMSEEEKEELQFRQTALELALEQFGDNADDALKPKTNLDHLPEDVRKQLEEREAALAKREEELGMRKAENKKAEQKAARAQSESRYREGIGKGMATEIQTFLDEQKKSGSYVPSIIMDYMVDNGHGEQVPLFGKNVMDAYKARINSVPAYKARLAELQLLPPTPENEKARLDYARGLQRDELPAIMRAELGKLQKKEKDDREKRIAERQAGRKDARFEPQSAAGGIQEQHTGGMTDEQAYAEATKIIERDFGNLGPAEKLAKKLELRGKLQRQGR